MHIGRASVVHIVNPLEEPCGGSEWRAIETWKLLSTCAHARLWSEYRPAEAFSRAFPVERIEPWRLHFPRGGTLVFIGAYFRIGHWVRFAAPDRVIVVYNTQQPDRLRKNLRRIAGSGRTAEVIYTSDALRRRERGHGPVLHSLVDVARFPFAWRALTRPFTVGRMSRDDPTKHHSEDSSLWRWLAANGMRVRIMGGTCLARDLRGVPNIELLPSGAEAPGDFLHSLDCFVYRTSERWFEGFGRVVVEAMATGLPVVCADRGGYVDVVDHGHNGLIFSSTEEAIEAVRMLRIDERRYRTLAQNASRSASRLAREVSRRTLRLLAPPDASPASVRGNAMSATLS